MAKKRVNVRLAADGRRRGGAELKGVRETNLPCATASSIQELAMAEAITA